MPDNSTASAKKSLRICPAGAPSALSRPISFTRCATAISITFMMSTPATARLIAAMPPTAMVNAVRMRSKVASTASWVMTVTSFSPLWRANRICSASCCACPMLSRLLASTSTRNRPEVLNNWCADATGMMTSSSVRIPIDSPCEASTPMTRKRRSPRRTHCPTARALPNSSCLIFSPSTHTEVVSWRSPAGRKRPSAMAMCRTSNRSAVEPSTTTSRFSASCEIEAAPTVSGAMRLTAVLRKIACASSSEISRGICPTSMPGPMPAVSVRPGNTITRLVPSEEN